MADYRAWSYRASYAPTMLPARPDRRDTGWRCWRTKRIFAYLESNLDCVLNRDLVPYASGPFRPLSLIALSIGSELFFHSPAYTISLILGFGFFQQRNEFRERSLLVRSFQFHVFGKYEN